ncbi:MAG: acetyl-CoA carboxylase carboxyl transferase subunit beta [Chloroflexi bacterium]|nr:acetyl-CoA carboxylase carboxyl transferase subunit beta [Chloroflexota bacterium]MCI0829095.1 acetyl-CoA carboxylase carboxyl transferase subunit beta [Chloroflexota bacterium]MCI0847406.1 acetyl-CoA carboxylase carboxyl transferase subunit beta [Chloroflexota bacterium]
MRNLANFLVHLFNREGEADRTYLSVVHDRCLFCEEPISDSPSYLTYRVCPYCRFHYTVTARERIELLADKGTFKETSKYVSSVEPLSFSRRARYRKFLAQDQKRTGLTEAAVTGKCRIGDVEVMLIVLDFGFMGGTMGSVVGEKVAMAFENAARRGLPAIAVVSGGGVRIQEGVLSLMQMAKTVTAANRLRDEEVPFIVVLANPSTGQAYASFANLADIILAEPGSLIGLSPLRTLREVSKMPLPLDAHTAEAHVGHGLLDNVVDRENLQPRVASLLQILTAQKHGKSNHKSLLKVELESCAEVEPWEAVTAARNSERPQASAYFRSMLDPFIELRGDRLNSDDRSVIAGLGFMDGQAVAVIGQQRRPLVEGERYHVFPDGLRKAQRVIDLASRFKLPLVTLIDTQGADPGLEAEEQGIGNAIAKTLSSMLTVPTPVVSVVIGEGGSEGALALGLSDRILMQQYAVYSPMSVNHTLGAAHHDYMLDREAAEALMLTAHDCLELGIADEVVPEPEGGAHVDPHEASTTLQTAILTNIAQLSKMSQSKLLKKRYRKFRRMGEGSGHSKEAMDREVDLLMSITLGESPPERPSRKQKRKGRTEEPAEAPVSSDD